MEPRNTPEAPALARCDTCGATKLDGNGDIVDLNGHPNCETCKQGALDLIAEEPQNYGFDADGRLKRHTPHPIAETRTTKVNLLLADVTAYLHRMPVQIKTFHPMTGVAVTLPNGYRLHVYIPGTGLVPTDHHHAVLFSPGLSLVPGFPPIVMPDLAEIRQAVTILTDPATQLGQVIEADALRRLEIDLFDADLLLRRGEPDTEQQGQ